MSIDVEYAIKKDVRNNPIVRGVDEKQRRALVRTLAVGVLVVACCCSPAGSVTR